MILSCEGEMTISDDHKLKLIMLSKCVFQVGSFDKRFVRNLQGQTADLTPKQALCLEKMFHRYRRQIPNHKKYCKVCSGEVEYASGGRSKYDDADKDKDKLER